MKRRWWVMGCVLGAALVGLVPLTLNAHLRNFRTVQEGVLYRSGQLSPTGLELVLRVYKIQTVVTFRTVRDPGRPYPDAWEEGVCAGRGARHIRIIPRSWLPDESGEPPALEMVKQFLEVMDDPANYPVLIHCFAGIHRTGTMAAVFRREYTGWGAEEAVAELERCGYAPGQGRHHVEEYIRGYHRRTGEAR